MIIESYTNWTYVSPTLGYRTWRGRIYQVELGSQFYCGRLIKYISVNTAIGREWLAKLGSI